MDGTREILRHDADARDHLMHDALVSGLDYFERRALRERLWTPAGGASLKSFFVGAVVLTFKDAYLRWERGLAHLVHETPAGSRDDIDSWLPTADTWSVQDELSGLDEVADYLATLDPVTRRIVELRMEGLSLKEIAVLHAMKADRVRARMHRLRTALLRDTDRGRTV